MTKRQKDKYKHSSGSQDSYLSGRTSSQQDSVCQHGREDEEPPGVHQATEWSEVWVQIVLAHLQRSHTWPSAFQANLSKVRDICTWGEGGWSLDLGGEQGHNPWDLGRNLESL